MTLDLTGTDCRTPSLAGTDCSGAKLDGADLSGATIPVEPVTWPCVVCDNARVVAGEGYCDDDGPKCDACFESKRTRADVQVARARDERRAKACALLEKNHADVHSTVAILKFVGLNDLAEALLFESECREGYAEDDRG